MRKIKTNSLVGIVAIAMISLLLIQFYQVSQLYDRKSKEFKANITTLIERIVIRHEKAVELKKYLHVVNKDFNIEYKDILKKEFQNLLTAKEKVTIRDTSIFEKGQFQKYLLIEGSSYDSISGLKTKHEVLARDVSQIKQLLNKETALIPNHPNQKVSAQLDQRVMHQIFKKSKIVNELLFIAFHDNSYVEPEKRIDIAFLDSIICYETHFDKLPQDYLFTITKENGEPLKFNYPPDRYKEKLDTTHTVHTTLFPSNILDETLTLYLKFPSQKTYLFKEMGIPFTISLLLVILIIITISYLFNTILSQEKLGELKNDFISNMTHEFKTPISTISLACQAMSDKDMIGDSSEKITPFVSMIDHENKRLEILVERILQSATIDKGNIPLKNETIDLVELTKNLCDTARFRLKSYSGNISFKTEIPSITISGDRMHISNMISNLIDNAIKYSTEIIDVSVSITQNKDEIRISIKDKGIGMAKEHISKIFDKLYRVPTGNIHNVKGFGLGLSYVKAISQLLGWNIQVKSQLGIGSEFSIIIPVK